MSLPSFIDAPRLELPRGWLYDVEPRYTVIAMRRSPGREVRNLPTPRSRIALQVTIPSDRVADIPAVLRFYRAVRSRLIGFRVQDPTDYLSTALGYHVDATDPLASPTDQPLVEVEGSSPPRYQLVKHYELIEGSTELIEERAILKPVEDTIRVANEAGIEQPSSRWSINSVGQLIKGVGFVGTPTAWGGQFDLPVRFDSELPLRVQDFRLDSTSFSLLELGEGEL